GTQVRDVADLFNSVDLNALSGGYVTGNSDSGLVVSENFGNDLDSNVLDGQLPVSRSSYVVPHFVTGGGYSSELSLLNMDPQATAQLTLTAFDNTGSAIGGSPIQISLPPGNQLVQAIDQVFPSLAGSFTTGYIRVDVATSYVGPFITAPPIVGSLRFTSSGGSTALPVWLAPSSDLVYAHVAQNGDYFTGVAMINTNQTALTADLQVLAGDGSSVGSVKIQLQPGQKLAKLLFELIPSSAGQLGGYVRIRSTLPMVSFSLFGTTDGKLLSAIPPQNVY
ncbi:MAG TPA: hypothetical protein VE398_01085, partial [Acidobacteriota bacterium]|nr:hypothetical protein [Acidobacteriota bacterium]